MDCKVKTCDKMIRCMDMCASHYMSYLKQPNSPRCAECEYAIKSSGICYRCEGDGSCAVLFCSRKIDCHMLCDTHSKPVVKKWLTVKEAINWYETGCLCQGCGEFPATDLDHCHNTNIFRGYLCGICNRTLGNLDTLSWSAIHNLLAYKAQYEGGE